MKKIFITIMMTAMVCGFMACSNSKAPATEQKENVTAENEQVGETEQADEAPSAESDRGVADSEGFGRCLESGCYCKEFKGRGETCRNCGHAYKRHY